MGLSEPLITELNLAAVWRPLQAEYLLMKQLMPCFRMRSTFSFIFSFSASSISATFAVESTRTLEPKIWQKQRMRTKMAAGVFVRSRTPYLDLVGVHARVCDQDLGVFQPFWLVHANLLVQQKT